MEFAELQKQREEKFNQHKVLAENLIRSRSYDKAIQQLELAIKVMREFGDAWIKHKKSEGNRFIMLFKSCSFAEKNIALVQFEIANCYFQKCEHVNAYKIYRNLNSSYIDSALLTDKVKQCKIAVRSEAKTLMKSAAHMLAAIGEPLQEEVQNTDLQMSWHAIREETNNKAWTTISSLIFDTTPGKQKSIDQLSELSKLYAAYEKYLTQQELHLANLVSEKIKELHQPGTTQAHSARPTARL